ncbi:transmembrane protein 140 isoform 1-T2 [Leptodactylus fuscus]|uniref:transmembrane protein 140 n=1 Tax=Leptodactylus fuscus TaxID=238119 RepID=UPI003F4E51A6
MAESQKKCCLSLRGLSGTISLVQVLVCSLLTYALIYGHGNVLVDGCKKIGFYNYCFRNATSLEDCYCFTEFRGLNSRYFPHGLLVSLILTYSSLVTVPMGLLILLLAQGDKDITLWKFDLGLNVFSLIVLFLGIITHLFLIWDQFDITHLTPAFLALVWALGGLSLQYCLMSHYIRLTSVWSTAKTEGHPAEDLSILVA